MNLIFYLLNKIIKVLFNYLILHISSHLNKKHCITVNSWLIQSWNFILFVSIDI